MLLFLDDATIRLGEQPAFTHTTWQIERGQHWAVLGPSGSGKTVLARALAGQLPLMGGQIRYFFDGPDSPGRSYLHPSEVLTFSGETHRAFLARFAGYHQARWQSFEGEEVPSVAGLLDGSALPGRSPFEAVQPAPERGRSFEPAALIDLLGLAPLLDRRVHLLSHGESRKVFLARLLLRAPRLLILDDPLTGLDHDTRARLRSFIDRLYGHPNLSVLYFGARAEELPAGATHLLQVSRLQVAGQGELPRADRRRDFPAAESALPSAGPASLPAPNRLAGLLTGYAAALKEENTAGPAELVRMSAVSVAYQDVPVLDNVHWTVRAGERWALLGPNGAGKTTLLSLILADNPQAYRSEIALFGRRRGSGESIWEIKRRTGWVSPELHAFYDRSAAALEVILSGFYDSIGLHHHPAPEQRAQALRWLEALGLSGLQDVAFAGLSAGQQRLALLGRALVKQPPLLILDEPCQGLDAQQRALFLGFIEQLCEHTPLALVYVTHEQGELPTAITHHLRLARGRVIACGPVR